MGKRYVDADILEDLAHNAGKTRGDLQDLLRKCEGQVSSVPRRGWDQGAWADVRRTLGSELTSLDDHGRALVSRAGRVREAAAERALQQLRELWAEIAGLRQKITSEGSWLRRFWENCAASLRKSVLLHPLPNRPGPGTLIGWLAGLALTWAWKEALQILHPTPDSEAPPDTPPHTPSKYVIETTIVAKEVTPLMRKTDDFVDNYNGKPVTDPGRFVVKNGQKTWDSTQRTWGCVALVDRYAWEMLGIDLGAWSKSSPNDVGGPTAEWGHPQAFDPNIWNQIQIQDLAANGGYQIGDIVFFDFNHVGVVTSVSGNGQTVEIMDQAYYTSPDAAQVRSYTVSGGNLADLYWTDDKGRPHTDHFRGVMRVKP